MSYMKRLLESFEPVSQDSLLWELLHNACPVDEWYHKGFGCEVKTYEISLHCATFVVECLYSPITSDYTVINYKKELS